MIRPGLFDNIGIKEKIILSGEKLFDEPSY